MRPGNLWLAVTLFIAGFTACSSPDLPVSETSGQIGERNPDRAIVNPVRRDATDDRIRSLTVANGFRIDVFARDLGNVRMMEVLDDGTVLVTRPEEADVIALRDTDGDGRADERWRAIMGLPHVHGIARRGNTIFLAQPSIVRAGNLTTDGRIVNLSTFVENLPAAGMHEKRTIAFGPDGNFYISVGSTCNACIEDNPESATILRTRPDGTQRIVFSRGLRNTIGFDWHPETGDMWGMDNGADWRGADQPPEELNHLVLGGDYGWPYAYGDAQPDPDGPTPEGIDKETLARGTVPSVLEYQAHSAPIGFVFYTGRAFPEDFQGDAFVAMRGSWNRDPPTGYKVVRVKFDRGFPMGIEDFVSGWLIEEGRAQFGRVAGLAIAADGALLISEDENGVIYRVSYDNGGQPL